MALNTLKCTVTICHHWASNVAARHRSQTLYICVVQRILAAAHCAQNDMRTFVNYTRDGNRHMTALDSDYVWKCQSLTVCIHVTGNKHLCPGRAWSRCCGEVISLRTTDRPRNLSYELSCTVEISTTTSAA